MTSSSNIDVLLAKLTEQSCDDMIRRIRESRNKETRYISSCMPIIKKQLNSNIVALKAIGVSKLIYLYTMGYDFSWATFNIIELMTSVKIDDKRIAFLAASLIFKEKSDMIIMATNLLRKSITSTDNFESAMAISCLGDIMTDSLAVELFEDVLKFMISVKPSLKKRSIILLLSIFLKSSVSLKTSFIRLKDCLEDSDKGVRIITCSVFCQLVYLNPNSYLPMAPLFFQIFTKSNDNNLVVKAAKMLNYLSQIEPKLSKKITESFLSLVDGSQSPSIVYEALITLVQCCLNDDRVIKIVIYKLKIYLESSDENLKYLALLILNKINKNNKKIVFYLKEPIFSCLENKDEFFKIKVLNLIEGMVNKNTLQGLCQNILQLINQATSVSFVEISINKIIEFCSNNNYENVNDFEWYISMLLELTVLVERYYLNGVAKVISSQILDVLQRVKAVRSFALRKMISMFISIKKQNLLVRFHAIPDILLICGWCIGEFIKFNDDEFLNCMNISDANELNSLIIMTISSLIDSWILGTSYEVQAVFIYSAVKLACRYFYNQNIDKTESKSTKHIDCSILKITSDRLNIFSNVYDAEVYERVFIYTKMLQELVNFFNNDINCINDIKDLFIGDLPPISANAQSKIPVPDNLNLEKPINPSFNSYFYKQTTKNDFNNSSNQSSNLSLSQKNDNEEDWESIVGPNLLTNKSISGNSSKKKSAKNLNYSNPNILKVSQKVLAQSRSTSDQNSSKKINVDKPSNSASNSSLIKNSKKEESTMLNLKINNHPSKSNINYVVEPLFDPVSNLTNNSHVNVQSLNMLEFNKKKSLDLDIASILVEDNKLKNQHHLNLNLKQNKVDKKIKIPAKPFINQKQRQKHSTVENISEEKEYRNLAKNDKLSMKSVYRVKNLQTNPILVVKIINDSNDLLIKECQFSISEDSFIYLKDVVDEKGIFTQNKIVQPKSFTFLQIPFIFNGKNVDLFLLKGSMDIKYTNISNDCETLSTLITFNTFFEMLEFTFAFKIQMVELTDLLMDGSLCFIHQSKASLKFKNDSVDFYDKFINDYFKKIHFYGVESSSNRFSAVSKYLPRNGLICLLLKIDKEIKEVSLVLKSSCDSQLLERLSKELINYFL